MNSVFAKVMQATDYIPLVCFHVLVISAGSDGPGDTRLLRSAEKDMTVPGRTRYVEG